MAEQKRGVTKTTIVFSLIVIISAVLSTSVYYLNSTPIIILSEELDVSCLAYTINAETFNITVPPSMNQVHLSLEVTECVCFSYFGLYDCTDCELCRISNEESFSNGTYTSEWIDVLSGNYTVEIWWGGSLAGHFTVSARWRQ